MKKVTDEEFIACWQKLQNATHVSKALGINLRDIFRRRRRLEKKYDMVLPSVDKRGNAPVPIDISRGVVRWEVENGMVFIFSDAHYWPGEPSTAHRGLIHLLKKFRSRVKGVICNGDAFDGASISRWPSLGWEHKPTVKQELEVVQDRLDEIRQAVPGAKFLWPCGNHDARFESRLANSAPEYAGVGGIHLKDHIPAWQPCWRVDINDDIVVRHREAGGEHADWNNVVRGGKTLICGHDHRIGVVPYECYAGLRYGVRTGMLADDPLDPQFCAYMEAKQPNWHSGFVILTFVDGQLLMPEIVRKWCDGAIEFRGEIIDLDQSA